MLPYVKIDLYYMIYATKRNDYYCPRKIDTMNGIKYCLD